MSITHSNERKKGGKEEGGKERGRVPASILELTKYLGLLPKLFNREKNTRLGISRQAF